MKKYLLVLGLLMACANYGRGCDICGCAAGGSYMGIMPMYQRNFIGFSYDYRFYTTYNLPDILTGKVTQMGTDNYHTVNLMARYYPSKRVQLYAFVPLNDYRTMDDNQLSVIRSVGDMSVLANYIVVNTGDSMNRRHKHTLLAGGGIKLPTGPTNRPDESGLLIPNMQPGTGSVDYIANLNYTYRCRKIGFNSEAKARLNTTNPSGYHFGDHVTGSAKAFYWYSPSNRYALLPNIGFTADYGAKDRDQSVTQLYTGGYLVNASAGVDYYRKNIVLGISCSLPALQNLSEGYVKAGPSVSFHLQYLFNSKN